MRKLLKLIPLLAVFLIPTASHAQAFDKVCTGHSTTSPLAVTCSISSGEAITAGCGALYSSGNTGTISFTDSGGNTWSNSGAGANTSGSAKQVRAGFVLNTGSSDTSVTCTCTTCTNISNLDMVVIAFTSANSPEDSTDSTMNNFNASTVSTEATGSFTPGKANEVAASFTMVGGSFTAPACTSPSTFPTSGSSTDMIGCYRINPATSAITMTTTWSTNHSVAITGVVINKTAAAATAMPPAVY